VTSRTSAHRSTKLQTRRDQLAVCKFDGATPEIIAAEVAGFIDHHLASNSFSHDWDATWRGRWRRWKEYTTKQAEAIERKRQREEKLPARVEVNKTIDYDNLVEHFSAASRGRDGIGPDPDSPACKAAAGDPDQVRIPKGSGVMNYPQTDGERDWLVIGILIAARWCGSRWCSHELLPRQAHRDCQGISRRARSH